MFRFHQILRTLDLENDQKELDSSPMVFLIPASHRNVSFDIFKKVKLLCIREGWKASPPSSAAAPPFASRPLCTLGVSLAPTHHQSRQTQKASAHPARRGSPSPRRAPPSHFHRPHVFQNRRTLLPQKARRYTTDKSLYNQQHITAIKNFSERRVFIMATVAAASAGRLRDVGLGLSSQEISGRCVEICWLAACAQNLYFFQRG